MNTRSHSAKPELSRRSVLQAVLFLAGIATMLAVSTNHSAAAKMPKAAVGYQDTPHGNQRCDNCALFRPPRACLSVEGDISPQGWCRIWVAKR